ncbi:class I SAM-dependent methyltransferase [Amycolatopsis sp. NBC_01480]|uniref:class I SAM-dependent methyltransferase n=1 Tax=Amycolatopsis sp. NBC_01480 TaxID=2903562 RepID=UPI002E2DCC7F|nr:class I SAM-dependent methyltransferase [Amycolatopsis sp. NBC_01480]
MGVTAVGCPVDVYLRLPTSGEPEIVHGAVPAGASILELGSGCGRVTHPLVALGHRVVAVDDSPEMLAHVREAETVCSRIGDLRLGRCFDVVLLGSHLLNTPDPVEARALLAAARRHLVPGGVVLVEWHQPEWFDRVASGSGGQLGDVAVALEDVARDGDLLSAAVRYSVGGEAWRQEFTCRRLSPEALSKALTSADLAFDRWVTADRDWFSAHGVAKPPPG